MGLSMRLFVPASYWLQGLLLPRRRFALRPFR